METVFIGFGSNVGDRLDFCDRAVTLLGLLGLVQACNTVEGAGKDVKNAGQATENAAERNK